mmetsp:Transcript_15134/g.33402  ORF Transcript_15134/g.33402 Transcript_15134/m.33402 type:complete len:511 (+) Transcript_15134:28-1560(+)
MGDALVEDPWDVFGDCDEAPVEEVDLALPEESLLKLAPQESLTFLETCGHATWDDLVDQSKVVAGYGKEKHVSHELPAAPDGIVGAYELNAWRLCSNDVNALREPWAADVRMHIAKFRSALAILPSGAPSSAKARAMADLADAAHCASDVMWGLVRGRAWKHVAWRHIAEREGFVLAQVAQWTVHFLKKQWVDAMHSLDYALIFGGPTALLQPMVRLTLLQLACCAPPPTTCKRRFPLGVPELARVPTFGTMIPRCTWRPRLTPADSPGLDGVHLGVLTDEEIRDKLEQHKPLVVEGVTTQWAARDKWTNLTFWESLYPRLVPVEVGVGEIQEYTTLVEQVMDVRTFVRRFLEGSAAAPGVPARCGYLAQHPLFAHIPQLQADFQKPDFIPKTETVNAWVGSGGTVTRTHYDAYENLLVQLAGFKFLRLYPPSDEAYLYPRKAGRAGDREAQVNLSNVEAENPNLDQYPLYAQASPVDVLLGPGDAVHIPSRWWHYVRSITPSISVSFMW